MALISQSVENLLDGISQKPAEQRLVSQGTAQVNVFDNPGRGKMKRPPLELLAKMSADSTGMNNAFLHTTTIQGLKFHVVVPDFTGAGGTVRVFSDQTGAEAVVNFPNGTGYVSTLPSGQTIEQFRAVTIGDYVFILNKYRSPAKAAGTLATRAPEALVFVRQADFSTTYKITVDATTLSYTTVDGSAASSRGSITTDNIAEQLRLLFVASALNATHTCTRTGSTLYIKRINNADFTVSATDGLSDAGILAIKGKIQRFDDLPLRAVNGFIVEISGDPGSEYDNYYVVYDDTGAASGAGVWREAPKPGEQYQLDASTMPHILTRDPSTSQWTFAQAPWRGREVGSVLTNEFPSFIGERAQDIFFTQNRLGLVAGESVVMSGTADLFNFFRKSAKALYDSDPIDVVASTAKVHTWRHVVEWNQKPLLFSDNGAQAVLTGDAILSPKTVRLEFLTAYETHFNVKPVVLGDQVAFLQVINGKTRLSMFRTREGTDLVEAVDLTSSVPAFLQGTPTDLSGQAEPGFLALVTDSATSSIYVFVFGNGQGSWSRWDIESTSRVVALNFSTGVLTIIVKRADGLYLEKVQIGKANLVKSAGDTTPVLLDHQGTQVGAGAGTSYLLPGGMSVATNGSEGEVVVVRNDTMAEVPSTRPDATHVQVASDMTGITLTIGIRYTDTYTFSPIAIVNQTRQGEMKETQGRLIVGHVSLRLADTQYAKVTVTSPEGTQYIYVYSKPTPFTSDTLVFPLQADAKLGSIVLSSDSVMQHTITGYDWEGHHVVRTARR
jgi:hypothetical protein